MALSEIQSKYNPQFKKVVLQVLGNQIAGKDENGQPVTGSPDVVKCVQDTFARLSSEYGEDKAKSKMADAVTDVIWAMMSEHKPFDGAKYMADLKKLK